VLKIRQEQLDAFAAARWDDFYIRVRKHVRQVFPAVTRNLDEVDLRTIFDSVVGRSHAFGLRTERQIVCMMDATMMLGDRFEEQPRHLWAHDILGSPYLIADDRAKLVLTTANRIARPHGLAGV
jgi:hypothetical protein